ncbi:MAG: hypothetical protein DWQ01_07785 [Planctomycetota bacterium]|nr:MAG: hypothetical protein DWQ01_07785 [Planctomycetota bacterium]
MSRQTGQASTSLLEFIQDLLRRPQSGIAGHVSHPAAVRTQIQGSGIGVLRQNSATIQGYSKSFRHHLRQDRVRTLADVGSHGMDGDAAVDVDFQMHRRLRRPGAVDRQSGTADVKAATQTDSAAKRHLAELLIPTAGFPAALQAFHETIRSDSEMIQRGGIRRQGIHFPQVEGIHLQAFGQDIQTGFQGETGVDGAVAAHGSARRFVGVNPSSGITERGKSIRPLAKHAVVVGRDHAKRCPSAAVDQTVSIQAQQAAFPVGGDLQFVLGWMATVVV